MRWEIKRNKVLPVIGILICLIGAILMVEGHGLGERTITVAIVLGICGISVIATSGSLLRQEKKPLTQKQQRIMYGMFILLVIAVVVTALLMFM